MPVCHDGQNLCVIPEGPLVVSEDRVADREPGDPVTDRGDHTGELATEYAVAGTDEAGEEPHQEGPGGPVGAVRAVDGGGVHRDEHVVAPHGRWVHLDDLNHLG